MAALNHPNIAQVYAIEGTDSREFIVMEYIRGSELKEAIRSGELSIDQKLDITQQIAKALKAAHGKGVIHRDIKSGNIMVDEDGNVKMLDFGLARIRGTEHITKKGTTLGTTAYMSPEQVMGEEVDEQSDIWSLGVVMYELFTGKLPFEGAYESAILYAITQEEPKAVSEYNPDIPGWLEKLIHTCLKKEKRDRYQSIDEIINELASTGTVGELQQKTGSSLLNSKFVYLWSSLLIIIVLLIFILPISEGPFSDWRTEGSESIQKLAVLNFQNIGGDSIQHAITNGMVETLSGKLSQIDRYRRTFMVVPPPDLKKEKIQSPGEAHRLMGVDLAVTGSFQFFEDTTRLVLKLIDAEESIEMDAEIIDVQANNWMTIQNKAVAALMDMVGIEQDPEIQEAIARGDPSQPEASKFYFQGRSYLQRPASKENFGYAIQMFKKAIGIDSSYALAYAGLGESYLARYAEFKAIEDIDSAKYYANRALEINDQLAPVKTTMGMIYHQTGSYGKAVRHFNGALDIDPDNIEALRNLAKAYEAQGLTDDAEDTYKRATNLRPDYPRLYRDLGVFYFGQGEYRKAIEQFNQQSELVPDNPSAYSNLGGMYIYLNKPDSAIVMLKKSVSIDTTSDAVSNLASQLYTQGNFAEAAKYYKIAVDLNPNDYLLWGNLAHASRWVPELKSRMDTYYHKAIEIGEKHLNVNPSNAELISELGTYYVSIGDSTKAINYTERALTLRPENISVKMKAVVTYELMGYREKALSLMNKEMIPYLKDQPILKDLFEDKKFKNVVRDSL